MKHMWIIIQAIEGMDVHYVDTDLWIESILFEIQDMLQFYLMDLIVKKLVN